MDRKGKIKALTPILLMVSTFLTVFIVSTSQASSYPYVGIYVGGNLHERSGSYWVNTALGLSYCTRYPSVPVAFLTLGLPDGDGVTCNLRYSKPVGGGEYDNIQWSDWDYAQETMEAFLDANVRVVVDFGPNEALIEDVIDTVFAKYPPHVYTNIIGFCADWEWVKEADKVNKIEGWVTKIKTYLPDGELYLTSWIRTSFGSPPFKDDTAYIFDGQGYAGSDDDAKLESMLIYFIVWRNHFSPLPSGHVWGYNTDKAWQQNFASSQAGLKDLQDEMIGINPTGFTLMYSETLLDQIQPLLPSEPLYEGEPPDPASPPASPPEVDLLPTPPFPSGQVTSGSGFNVYLNASEGLILQHEAFNVYINVHSGELNGSSCSVKMKPTTGELKFTARENATVMFSTGLNGLRMALNGVTISNGTVKAISSGESYKLFYGYVPLVLPIQLMMGLGGMIGLIIGPIYMALKARERDWNALVKVGLVITLVSLALFLGWLMTP